MIRCSSNIHTFLNSEQILYSPLNVVPEPSILFRLWLSITGKPPIGARRRHRMILVLIHIKTKGSTLPRSQSYKYLGLLLAFSQVPLSLSISLSCPKVATGHRHPTPAAQAFLDKHLYHLGYKPQIGTPPGAFIVALMLNHCLTLLGLKVTHPWLHGVLTGPSAMG